MVLTDSKKTVYVGGDCLMVGSQMLRDWEKEQIKKLGFDVYVPQDDKEINDKTNQSVESNNDLPKRIFDKDTTGMINADILIFDMANTSVGTVAEVGQWAMIHRMLQYTADPYIEKLASKPIFFHSSDVRDTDIPESGYHRSIGYNAYMLGSCYECNPNGIQTWDEIMGELKEMILPKHIGSEWKCGKEVVWG